MQRAEEEEQADNNGASPPEQSGLAPVADSSVRGIIPLLVTVCPRSPFRPHLLA